MNSVALDSDVAGVASLRLTADSTLRLDQVFNVLLPLGVAQIDLAGHALHVYGHERVYNSSVTEGTLHYAEGSVMHGIGTGRTVDASGATLDMQGFLMLDHGSFTVNVSNYLSRAQLGKSSYATEGVLNVWGRFTPATNQYWGCVMQDGSTVDLSTAPLPFSLTTPTLSCVTSKDTVAFADNAHVTLDCRGRYLRSGDYVLTWNEAPANLSTLVFSLDSRTASTYAELRQDEDGVYVYRRPTIILIR